MQQLFFDRRKEAKGTMSEVPRVPGTGYSEQLSAAHHRKTHFFDFKNGMPVIHTPENSAATSRLQSAKIQLPDKKPQTAGDAVNLDLSALSSSNRPGTGQSLGGDSFTPGFAALDRKVLRFSAFTDEEITESRHESNRIRLCHILYYLVDDSMQVSEPRVLNSGLTQGAFLKRHRIPREDGSQEFLHWRDLEVGMDLYLYNRAFHIADADAFTREFYESNGVRLTEGEEMPEDTYTKMRTVMMKPPERIPRVIDWNLRKKLNNPFAKKCLRFFACWDDRENLFGEKRPYVVNYFIEDETIEVLEVKAPNDGRDSFPRMLKRQRVPRSFEHLTDLYSDHLTAADLRVGTTIQVLGREFFLYACDDSTKEFLKANFGLTEQDFPDLVDEILEQESDPPKNPVPPHTGIGEPEDTLQSVKHLVPRAPRRDVTKKLRYEGMMIRWLGKLKDAKPDDEDRRFIISFNLAEDEMSIFERPVKNSGIIGGSFMARERVWKPGKKYQQAYGFNDFVEGGVVVAHGHSFELIESDEFTKKLLKQFHEQEIENEKLAEIAGAAIQEQHDDAAMMMFKKKLNEKNRRGFWQFARLIDKDSSGQVSLEEMWEGCKMFNIDITREGMERVMKRFDNDGSGDIDYREMAKFMGEGADLFT